METDRKIYPRDHWVRSDDPEKALAAYLEQQSKAYSRTKNAYIRELLGDLTDKRFLDFGCGAGLFTVYAAQSGAAGVVGVDAEASVLATARHFARKEDVEHLCSFIRSEEFPAALRRPALDVILMKDVIEHVPDDDRLLSDAAAALVPGGTLVLSTQNSLSLNYALEGAYHRLIKGNKSWCGWDETHLRFYSPAGLAGKLKAAGFERPTWRSVYIVPYKLPPLPFSRKKFLRIDSLSWIDRTLGWVFPYNRLGWNLIVKARTPLTVAKEIREEPRLGRSLCTSSGASARQSFL